MKLTKEGELNKLHYMVPKIKNTVIYVILVAMFGLVAQSCHSGKKCGCEGDLMGNYKIHKRSRY